MLTEHRNEVLRELGALRDTREGRGQLGTWSVMIPGLRRALPFVRLPLDDFLVGRGLLALERGLGLDIGSDHLPEHVDVVWRRGPGGPHTSVGSPPTPGVAAQAERP